MVELDTLDTMDLATLRVEWRRLFGDAVPRLSAEMTRRALAYRLQEKQQGGLSSAVRQKLQTYGIDTYDGNRDPGTRVTEATPGTRLLREWNGRTYSVLRTSAGYEYDGRTYHSLSAVARDITGARWSGPRFFGLTGNDGAR